jgi:hypothetical protein
MAGDTLFDTISVEGLFGKNEICFLSCTPVGKAISDKKDGIIFFSVDLNEFLFAGSAKTALFLGVRERNVYSFPIPEMGTVGIERDFREVVDFQNLLDVEIKTIADDFDIDVLLMTVLVENRERRVDVGMLFNKTEDG